LNFRKNTLNRRQYASKGSSLEIGIQFFTGTEKYDPGNIYRDEKDFNLISSDRHNRNWFKGMINSEKYVFNSPKYTFGYLAEAVLSNRPLFSTFKSTILSAPAFNPLQDSKSLYLENFRANSYTAIGLKNVFHLRKNIDLRAEGFIFQPFKEFTRNGLQSVTYGDPFKTTYFAYTAGLVYNTLAGPISLSFNHYDDEQKRNGVMFHIGFLIYNKRSFE